MRFLMRSAGFLLLTVAFAAVVVDGTRSVVSKRMVLFSFGETLDWLRPAWREALDRAIDRGGIPGVQEILPVITVAPTFAVAGLVGLILLVAGRRPRPKIGYSSRP